MSSKIPEGYQTVTVYLIVNNAAEFIQFTKDVFNAGLLNKHMRDENIIMHAEIKIGNSIIMLADSTDEFSSQPAGFFIYVDDADATFKLALEKGAIKIREVADQSYGRSGGVRDPFGNSWWITSLI